MIKKIRNILSIVVSLTIVLCGCGDNSVEKNSENEDVLAKIFIDGVEVTDFNHKVLQYDILLPNEVLVQPEISAENTLGNSDGIKYKYPDTIEGVYMLKYKGVVYELNLQYDTTPKVLNNSYYRLTQDKELNIAYFGGSVTGGYGASDESSKSWASLVTQHLKSRFSDAKINSLNAAIGGTGTHFGGYRTVSDMNLENYIPDLVFIEFAVNDVIDNTEAVDAKRYLETIIRTVYSYSPNADIVMIFITGIGSKGEDFAQLKAHRTIADQYNIPCINVGKALCSELDAYLDMNYVTVEHPEWLKYFKDTVHPNDAGYAKYASYITTYIDKIFYAEREAGNIEAIKYPEKPVTEVLANPEMFNATGKGNIGNFNVTKDGYLTTETDGATLTVQFTGTSLKLWCYAGPMGADCEYTVDGNEIKTISLKKDSPNHRIFVLADNLNEGEHTIKMVFKKSTGTNVDIRYFLVTGETNGKNFSISN